MDVAASRCEAACRRGATTPHSRMAIHTPDRAPRRPAGDARSTAAADTAPRFAALWACSVYAVLVLALSWPALAGQFLVNPSSDQYLAGFAFRDYGASGIRAGAGVPLWNPYLMGGVPFVAGMGGDIFYPVALALRWLFPTDVAMNLGFMVHTFLCGLFTYGFLRAAGFGFRSSLLGGVAYLLSGPIASYPSPGHDGKLYVSAMLPLVLWMVVRGVRDGRRWAWGVMSIAIGLAVLSPHPQLLQYMLLTSGAFGLWVAFASHDGVRLERAIAVRRLAYSAGAVVLGGLMGAIQYVPVREYVDWSPRAGGKGWEHAVSYSLPPEEMVNFYLPEFTGILERYWGRNGIHLHSEYLGVVVLVLASLAFATRARRGFMLFWLVAFVVSLLWALGGNTPFYRLVYAIVPGTKFFRAPSTILYVVQFSVAMLAAIGAERALSTRISARTLIGWGIGAIVVALLATTGALTNMATSFASPERYDMVQANAGAVIAGAWRSLVFVGAAVGILFALGSGRLRPSHAGWALLGAMALDLWLVERRYWMFMGPAREIFASDPAIDYIKAQPEPGRVIPLALQPTPIPHDPYYHGDGFMVHRVRSAIGYHGNELGRYQVLFGHQQRYLPVFTNPLLWRLSNARYLYLDSPIAQYLTAIGAAPGDSSAFTHLIGPVRNSAGATVYLYRLPGDNPAAWVTPLIVKAPDDAVLNTLTDRRFDPRTAALFDTSAHVTAREVTTLPAPIDVPARVTRLEPGSVSVELGSPAPAGSALMLAENYYPGWTATVDGRPAAVGRANFVLTGVELPAGGRRVELRFRSAPYETGKMLTLVAIAVALLISGFGFVTERRARG